MNVVLPATSSRCIAPLVLALSMIGATQAPVGTAQQFRPRAIPLVACDPYFSIWSTVDTLSQDWPRHWTGTIQALDGMIRIDGKSYRIMGKEPSKVQALDQRSVVVLPTRTIYEFEGAGIHLRLTFLTPAIASDLELVSRPVTYLIWEVRAVDGGKHAVSLYYDNSAELAVNTPDEAVEWSRVHLGGLRALRIGTQAQPVLGKSGDDLRIDWGYFYLGVPQMPGTSDVMTDHSSARNAFAERGVLPPVDDLRMPRPAEDEWPVLAVAMNLGDVGTTAVTRHLILAYDDLFSIEYFERKLRPYWRRNGAEASDLLLTSEKEFDDLVRRCTSFDESLMRDLTSAGGEEYARIAALAYRQCLAAQKLAVDMDGTPLYFPKENFSNGCISTVDVLYPASPMLLLFNPRLMEASIRPVLEYAATPRWRHPYAPHDLGTYPLANGQVYGGGEKTDEYQMPVEECGNMLLMVAATCQVEKSPALALKFWKELSAWASYLREKGLDPENQLCTDDFAGHLAHNTNLSIKAILALGAYAHLCEMTGKKDEASAYRSTAREYAKRWITMAEDGDHYRLAFDKPGTWSQKYNLVWDEVLGLHLFPREVAAKEIKFYLTTMNEFGLPLDNRKDWTKLDWTLWTASLASSRKDFDSIVARVYHFCDRSPSRVPMTDWYWTVDGKQAGFQARSVVGGVFMPMIREESLWNKWSKPGSWR